jgi:hypothetical protein
MQVIREMLVQVDNRSHEELFLLNCMKGAFHTADNEYLMQCLLKGLDIM